MAFNGNKVLGSMVEQECICLSKPQKIILSKMEKGKEYTAKDLQVNITQMVNLVRKGYAREKDIEIDESTWRKQDREIRKFVRVR